MGKSRPPDAPRHESREFGEDPTDRESQIPYFRVRRSFDKGGTHCTGVEKGQIDGCAKDACLCVSVQRHRPASRYHGA